MCGIVGVITLVDGGCSFGLWDDKKKRLLLARDRAGVKRQSITMMFRNQHACQ